MPSSILNSDDGVISGTSGLKSSGGDDGVLVFQSKGTETARINTDKQIVAAAGTASLPALTTTGDVNTGIFFPGADRVGIVTGGSQRVEVDSSGRVTAPFQPGCMAYRTGGNQSISDQSETKVDLAAESYDIGSVFNTSTSTFTAPIAGRYLVIAAVSMAGAERIHCGIWINGINNNVSQGMPSAYLQTGDQAVSDGSQQYAMNSRILNLAANDYVNLYVYHDSGGTKNLVADRSFLNIILLG